MIISQSDRAQFCAIVAGRSIDIASSLVAGGDSVLEYRDRIPPSHPFNRGANARFQPHEQQNDNEHAKNGIDTAH